MVQFWLLGMVIYVAIDAFWLMVLAKGFMVSELGPLLSESPRLWAAGLFYVFHVIGLMVFVLQPYQDSTKSLFLYGCMFGFLVYAGFDFTCLAVIKGYTIKMAVVDLLWGTLLNGVACVLIVSIARQLSLGRL